LGRRITVFKTDLRLGILGAGVIAGVSLILAIPGVGLGGILAWALGLSFWPTILAIAGLGAVSSFGLWKVATR
jgi:hypothetical protein